MAWKNVNGSYGTYEFNEKTHEVRNAKTHVKVGERTNKSGNHFYRLSINGKKRTVSWGTIVKGIPDFNVRGENERVCANCGKKFNAHNSRSRFCSKRCKRRNDNVQYSSFHVKRAKKYGVDYERGITLPRVIKKFGGICQMCGKKVNTGAYKDIATIDHIVALKNGGSHTWENVQLLCLSCNSKKADYEDR